jgi:hypothetical protein
MSTSWQALDPFLDCEKGSASSSMNRIRIGTIAKVRLAPEGDPQSGHPSAMTAE